MLTTRSAFVSNEHDSLLTQLDAALAQTDDLQPLDDARFLETHAIYEARSDQRRRIIAWFRERIPPLVAEDSLFRVLSVGCGTGPVDVPIATCVAPRTDALVYVGVNPNRVECEDFARAFAREALPDTRLEVVSVVFDDFEAVRQFELVHFVHSLYYMADAAAALERARQMLAPGGRLVVLHAPREELNDLAARFYDRLYGRPTLFADDINAILERSGCRYERTRLDARVEVTELFGGDQDIGLALRDFILQVDSQSLPPAVQKFVECHLRLIAREDGGRWFIAHPVDAFVIDG